MPSEGVNGPDGEVEKPPVADDVVTVSPSGCVTGSVRPAAVRSSTVIGADGAPGCTDCGGVVIRSPSGCHVASDFHADVKAAPSSSPPHQRLRPGGPHAATPGSFGSPG